MENLSREGIFDIALVFGYSLGVFLWVSALLSRWAEKRNLGIAMIRFLGGLVIIVILAVVYSSETSDVFPIKDLTDSWSLLTIAGTVIMAVSIGELAVSRIAVGIDSILSWIGRSIIHNLFVHRFITYSGNVVVVTVSAVVVLVALPEVIVDTTPNVLLRNAGTTVILDATYPLPGGPMALVFDGEFEGYISLSDGQIIRLELPQNLDGNLVTRVVADNIDGPRGLAILDDVLYVADLGPMPCRQFRCQGSDIEGMEPFEGEAHIIEQSDGSVFAFDVLANGDLGNKRTILAGLPAANFAHGPNGMTVGPDGLIYLSIGGVLFLHDHPELIETLDGPNVGLIGKIVRFKPDGSELEIFAEGLRNVYGLTFDDEGLLWGVDNDGLTNGGWREEEVLQIKQGANYGYPYEGTFGPHSIRDDNAVWIMDAVGSAGIEWAGNLGLSPGLILGTCVHLRYLNLKEYENGRFLSSQNEAFILAKIPGCATIVEPGPGEKLMVGVFDTAELHQFTLLVDRAE